MVDDGAKKYEFGDQGSLLLMVEDEEPTDQLQYSWDFGKTWFVSFHLFVVRKLLNLNVFIQDFVRLRGQSPSKTSHDYS